MTTESLPSTEEAIDFARTLVNSDNPKYQKMGKALLQLKDSALRLTVSMIKSQLYQ